MASQTLSDQPSEALTELYFDCEQPDERDAIFEVLAGRTDGTSKAFLEAVMGHDDDPFMRAQAAHALLGQGVPEARAQLLQILEEGGDELLFEEAMAALLEVDGPSLFGPLQAIVADGQRDLSERRLAMVGMDQADPQASLAQCRGLLGHIDGIGQLPLDLLSFAVAVLVRSGDPVDQELLAAAVAKLPQEGWADGDDREAVLEILAEGQALMGADPLDEAG
jgi:hypothetical protein